MAPIARGNVRELENVIERALILSPGFTLRIEEPLATPTRPTPDRLDEIEREHILRMLERCDRRINGEGNAAAVLGLEPSTLRSRMQSSTSGDQRARSRQKGEEPTIGKLPLRGLLHCVDAVGDY